MNQAFVGDLLTNTIRKIDLSKLYFLIFDTMYRYLWILYLVHVISHTGSFPYSEEGAEVASAAGNWRWAVAEPSSLTVMDWPL